MPRGRPGTASFKPIFKDLVIALAGPLDGQWTDANISRWVTQREGRFAAQMNASVTHLICSEEAFKARGPRVKEALTRPRTCFLVTKDWLEDSINEKKRLSEDAYGVDRAERVAKRRKREEEKLQRGEQLAERAVNPYHWHTYRDGTFFRYEVVISRMEGEVERRFELTLYESNAKRPHLYWFVAKFFKRKGDSQPNYYRPSESPGLFWREFCLFEHFFEQKTGIPWDKRLMLCTPAARAADAASASGGGTEKESGDGDLKTEFWHKLEEEGRRFVYEPPTGGKPVGWAPKEFIPVVVEESVPVAGEEAKAQAQTHDTTAGVADQPGGLGEADVEMLDADEHEIVKTHNDEKHTPDARIKDTGLQEEQDEDMDVATDANGKDTSVEQHDPHADAEDTGVEEAQDDIGMAAEANNQDAEVEEIQGDAVMSTETDTKGSDTSIHNPDVGEVQEATTSPTQHPDVKEIQEVTAMTLCFGTPWQWPKEMQEDAVIMDSDAVTEETVTEDTNINKSQDVASMLTDIDTKDAGVDVAPEATPMTTEPNIKDRSVDKVRDATPKATPRTADADTNTKVTGVDKVRDATPMAIPMTTDADTNTKVTGVEEFQEDTGDTSGTESDSTAC